jgi:pimeloyl-ACP methyl ester carboxylesterase
MLVASANGSRAFAAPVSETFEAHGVRVHYLIEGTGEPVLLIHGLDSSARINWEMPGVMNALAKTHEVIALDLPGYGQSDKPTGDNAYGEQWVEDVILLLDHLKFRKAHIVGYSMGGIVVLRLIAEHPERALSGTLGGMGWLPDAGALQKIWAHMRSPAARGVSQLALTEEQVRSIRVPVIVISGENDKSRRLYVVPLQKVRSDWRVIDVRGANHLSCIYKRQFIDEIVRWIASNAQARASVGLSSAAPYHLAYATITSGATIA